MFEPVAEVLFAVSILILISSIIGIIASFFIKTDATDKLTDTNSEWKKRELNSTISSASKGYKYSIAWFIPAILVCMISNPLSEPFEIYKKVLIVRGVESKTADKLVDNINALLDFTEQKIRSASVEDVKEIIKEELKKEIK